MLSPPIQLYLPRIVMDIPMGKLTGYVAAKIQGKLNRIACNRITDFFK